VANPPETRFSHLCYTVADLVILGQTIRS